MLVVLPCQSSPGEPSPEPWPGTESLWERQSWGREERGSGLAPPGGKGDPLPPLPQTGITGAPLLQSGGLGLDAAGHLPH